MPTPISDRHVRPRESADANLCVRIRQKARELGFEACGITDAGTDPLWRENLESFLEKGFHGDMAWLARRVEERSAPRSLWPAARSMIVLARVYGSKDDPLADLEARSRGVISVYARARDYHRVVGKQLKALAGWLVAEETCEVKVFVDTAPVMEKPLAARSGLGWQGKHTNLVSRRLGSWFFLGIIFTTLELEADTPEQDHCGSCRACLDICPTRAFPAPRRLDARRCISYLTIEHRGHIDREFREAMGNRIYGCDDCLAVCPWNKFARMTQEPDFLPRAELDAPRLADLAELDDAAFRALFSGSAIKRTGRDRFVRNVMIALGNSGDGQAIPTIEARLGDGSPLVRAMAVWALARLVPPDRFATARDRWRPMETDADVRSEWDEGLHE